MEGGRRGRERKERWMEGGGREKKQMEGRKGRKERNPENLILLK